MTFEFIAIVVFILVFVVGLLGVVYWMLDKD